MLRRMVTVHHDCRCSVWRCEAVVATRSAGVASKRAFFAEIVELSASFKCAPRAIGEGQILLAMESDDCVFTFFPSGATYPYERFTEGQSMNATMAFMNGV